MTKNLDKEGLKSIVENYDIFYIDLWGVIHNGINLHQNAIEALEEITKAKKKLVIIKDGDHSLSNKQNLKKIVLELNKIVSNII